MAMIGWMLLLHASLRANEPTAVLAPYTMNGVGFTAGAHGSGKRWCAYKETAAVKAARGIVAASVYLDQIYTDPKIVISTVPSNDVCLGK